MGRDSQSVPQRLGKYELRERLGYGGMAEVWKAFDTELERYVAIKLLHAELQDDPEFIKRFSREAKAIASLHHPNIMQIHDFQTLQLPGSNKPIAYMVMNYVEGQTLARYIHDTSRLGKFPPAADIVQLFASISQAIDYAHQHGMIHRDIKPSNILLDKHNTKYNAMGEPILTDFGIAKLMANPSGTMSGMWLGTPLYISPEQAQRHPGNERSDIYSLGVILYEICTGVQPFRGESIASVMMQHINAMPTPPTLINPGISPALAMVIMRGLAKDPIARFSSAFAMTTELAEALNMPIPAHMGPPSYEMEGPTYLSPVASNWSSGMIPSLAPPLIGSRQLSQSVPPSSVSVSGEQGNSTPPMRNTPADSARAYAVQNPYITPSLSPSGATPVIPSSRPSLWGQRRGFFLALIALVILVLLGSGVGAFYWFAHPLVSTNQIVGHTFFVSSGEVSMTSNQGINDELLVDLPTLPDPASGKSYYAWMLGDENQPLTLSLSLGKLAITHGKVHVHYPGDAHHTNLLASYSRFLITEEDTSIPPVAPSPDKSAWRYLAELPQSGDQRDMMHESALTHLRHLLVDTDSQKAVGLRGGLDIWLFRNTEKVYRWAGGARDFLDVKDTVGIHNYVIRILYYLDGEKNVQQDLPTGSPMLGGMGNTTFALLGPDSTDMESSGYLSQIDAHLSALTQAPGVSQENRALAAQIDQEINNVKSWLEAVHKDAKQLVTMTSSQLLTPNALSLLDDMLTQTRYAYIGTLDPDTNQVQGGVVQIHDNIQRLAAFDITPYISQ